jgi:hypothetical protein
VSRRRTGRARLVAVALTGVLAAACGTTVQLPSGTAVSQGAGSELGSPVAQRPGSTPSAAATDDGLGLPDTPDVTSAPTRAGHRPASGGTTARPRPSSSASRGPVNHKSIRIGFMATDFAALAASFGFSGGAVDVLRPFKDFVAYLNKRGGMAGRPIEGDYYYLNGTSPDPTAAFQAACTHFTQDKHVDLVITDHNYSQTFEACLAKAGVVHFDSAKYGLDAVAQRQSPNYLAPVTLGVDRYTRAQIEAAVSKGWITRGQKVGVLIEGCPANIRTYNKVWVPLARKHGFSLIAGQTVCSTSGQLGNGVAQIQSAELRFRSANVKAVSFVSSGDGFLAVLFATNAQTQGWHPLYLLSSISTAQRGVESQSSGLSVPPGQLPQIRGIGWVPMTDVGPLSWKPSAAQQAQQKLCHRMSPSDGGANSAPDRGVRLDFIAHFQMDCDTMLVVKEILEANGGHTSLAGITSVYRQVLSSYTAASNLGGRLRASGSRTDGAFMAAPFSYNGGCKCVRYVGPAHSVR